MHNYLSLVFCLMFGNATTTVAQLCLLNAQYENITSNVVLHWNMVTSKAKTTYILLRSTDAKSWIEIVTEKVLQNYTEEDLFDYDDKVNSHQKYFYRLKITDANNNTIAFSNTVTISTEADKSSWVIYPNPVNDILYLLYQADNAIKGVINVTVQDITGKIVTRFRAASNKKRLEIPVSRLSKGIYVVQISILNEIVMIRKFSKQ